MREIVRLINKKDLEEIIELEIKLNKFYKDSHYFELLLLPNRHRIFFVENIEVRQKINTSYINTFIFYVDLFSEKVEANFSSDTKIISFKQTDKLDNQFTPKNIVKHIEQIIDKYNKEQDFFTFVWGDEE